MEDAMRYAMKARDTREQLAARSFNDAFSIKMGKKIKKRKGITQADLHEAAMSIKKPRSADKADVPGTLDNVIEAEIKRLGGK